MEGIIYDRVQRDTMCQQEERPMLPLSGENSTL